jgi:hypothetical protein
MATVPQYLTVDDFERQYGHENSWEIGLEGLFKNPCPPGHTAFFNN